MFHQVNGLYVMINKLKYYLTKFGLLLPLKVKKTLRKIVPNRFYEKLSNQQVVLISFPKSGRSWLRLMLCDMVNFQFKDAENIVADTNLLWKIHPLVPYFTIDHDDACFKSPAELNLTKENYSNAKVIFLVRDPRDVIVSWYFQLVKRNTLKQFTPQKFQPLKVSSN